MGTILEIYTFCGSVLTLRKKTSLSQQTIEKVKEKIPVYHTRLMRQVLQSKFGRVTAGIKPCVLRALYKDLTNDH